MMVNILLFFLLSSIAGEEFVGAGEPPSESFVA